WSDARTPARSSHLRATTGWHPTARATPRMVPYSCHRRRHSAGSARIGYGVAGAAISTPHLAVMPVPQDGQGLPHPPRDGHPDLTEVLDDAQRLDRKSTRLNSSHVKISYAVFCLKKKKTQ